MSTANVNTFSPKSQKGHEQYALSSVHGKKKIVVIGAGAFGSWAAFFLLQKGLDVTLIDTWGAGNSRSSSGDETRLIRSTYGSNEFYFDLNVRALELWKYVESRWNKKIFYNTGVLWLCHDENTPIVDDSIPFSKKHRMEYEYLSHADLAERYPLLNTSDLHHAFFDPYGGYLKARESCLEVLNAFQSEGGTFLQSHVNPGPIVGNNMEYIELAGHSTLKADVYLFACGSWLEGLFPKVFKDKLTSTKQEVYYFGVPFKDANAFDQLPAWIDVDGKDHYYGIPGNLNRGFKIGVDKRGIKFDPTHSERTIDQTVFANARKYIEHRFPKLNNAPLIENRVCPYENSSDGNFIFDLHPEASNVVLLGGGSGHGFKHGPALGELVADVFTGEKNVPALFSLSR